MLRFILISALWLATAGIAPAIRYSAARDSSEVTLGWIKPLSASEISGSNWSVGAETMDRDFTVYENWKQYLGPLGFKKARIISGWARTEAIRGQYDWKWMDQVVTDMKAQGVTPWVTLAYGNPLYTTFDDDSRGDPPRTEEAFLAWEKYVSAFVNRYKDGVHEYEIWNEPRPGKGMSPEYYATLVHRTAGVIRSVQPGAFINILALDHKLFEAATGMIDAKPEIALYTSKTLGKLRELQALSLVDGVTFHPYSLNPDDTYTGAIRLLELVRSYDERLVIIQGENGAPSEINQKRALADHPWTERSQAKWALRRLLGDLAHGIPSSYFSIADMNYDDEINRKGLLRAKSDKTIERPKMAYYALQNLASVFDDRLTVVPENIPEINSRRNIAGYVFSGTENKPIVSLWLNDRVPADTNDLVSAEISLKQLHFEEPVYVDLISGEIKSIDPGNIRIAGEQISFSDVRIPDYPVLIAERSLLTFYPAHHLAEPISFPLIGKIQPRHALDITSSNWSVGAEMMDRDFTIYDNWKAYLGPLGVKKARIQSGWARTEKRKGVYDWEWLDKIIYDMSKQGVKPWVNLSYGNPLYSDGGGTTLNAPVPKSEEAKRAWENYIKAIVSRYGHLVEEWEVWNEPNYKITPEDYADLFIPTAKIIRTQQPSGKIIAFAVGSGVDYRYVEKVLRIVKEKNSLDLIDEISHHRHIRIPENREPELELEKIVARYNPAIRIRQGEAGCPSAWNGNFALSHYPWNELIQSKHILRRLLTDLGHDKESSCFTIMDARYPQEWNYKGLLKSNEDKTVAYAKPAYYAFQHLISVFDDRLDRIPEYEYRAERDENRLLSLYGFRHRTSGKQVITVWFSDRIPSSDNKKSLCDFVFAEGNFDHPVWVDLATGNVHEIPRANWEKKDSSCYFRQIPVYDAPILIADRQTLQIITGK